MQPNCIVIFLLQNIVFFKIYLLIFYFSEGRVDADTVPAKLTERLQTEVPVFKFPGLCAFRFRHSNFEHAIYIL